MHGKTQQDIAADKIDKLARGLIGGQAIGFERRLVNTSDALGLDI
jgi:hypothetical protein